jgi:hypothetical protein
LVNLPKRASGDVFIVSKLDLTRFGGSWERWFVVEPPSRGFVLGLHFQRVILIILKLSVKL